MTHQEFIEAIAKSVQKHASNYGIKVHSPIIAQAILESAWGTSSKAKHHNYFGLKYRANRVSCHSGTFVDGSAEQLANGSYIPITDQWYAFESLDKGVEGYFQFINISNYQALKGETDPLEYLKKIKKAGYATSQNYVDNVYNVIKNNSLTKYDMEVSMANSSLATYSNITRNHSGKRTAKITKITPHYMAAAWSGRQCADYFAGTGRQASSNYCVGVNGDIAVSVPEDCRAWTSSSEWNDQRAVTIECGNNPDSSLPDACYKALVNLCADICKRNGINPHFDGTVDGTITFHSMFASTSCPGNWLRNKITSGQFEEDIKNAMGKVNLDSRPEMYRVRKSWADSKSQLGAYRSIENAKKACKAGYSVFDSKGNSVYTNSGKTQTQWVDDVLKTGDTVKSKSCSIAVYPGTSSAIVDDCVYVPALGGLVPLEDVSEAADTKDGKQDDYLANLNSRVYLTECKVEGINAQLNLAKVHGYWVNAEPLLIKR